MKYYLVSYNQQHLERYDSWPKCQKAVNGVSGVRYKSFNNDIDARRWVSEVCPLVPKSVINKAIRPLDFDSEFLDSMTPVDMPEEVREEINNYCSGSKPVTAIDGYDFKSVPHHSNECTVWVDGSFMPYKGIGYAYLIEKDGKVIDYLSGYFPPGYSASNNVIGEITASILGVTRAIEIGFDYIKIAYDYIGIANWVTGEWQAKNSETRSYRDKMRELLLGKSYEFIKVDSHTGVKLNEMVDKLAKEAILNRK